MIPPTAQYIEAHQISIADPQAVGEWLLSGRETKIVTDFDGVSFPRPQTLSERANRIPWHEMSKVKSASLVDETVVKYVEDLKVLRDEGNPHATFLLEWYEAHGSFQGAPSEPAGLPQVRV